MFVGRNLKRYVVVAVAAPVAGRLLVRQAEAMRAKSGQSTAADRLEKVGSLLQRGRRR
ncbi:MAG: hypothetical protein ACJ74O_01365 [Frankiaceae bacterium]